MRNWIFLLAVVLSTKAWAYDTFPEYVALGINEVDFFNEPELFDNGVASDYLVYQLPFRWLYQQMSQPSVLAGSIGSISFENFLLNNSLKLEKQLADDLVFKLVYFDQKDFTRQFERFILELNYWFSDKWGLALYGEPTYNKAYDDIGWAILYKFHERHVLRLFYTLVDFSRNEQNDDSDEWAQSPDSWGFVGRFYSDKDSPISNFVEYSFRYERLARWQFPDELKEFRFHRTYAAIRARHFMPGGSYVNFGTNLRRQMQENQPLTGGTLTPEKVNSTMWEVWMEWEGFQWCGFCKVPFLGLRYVNKFWDTFDGNVTHRDWLPYIWFRRPNATPGDWGGVWGYNLELTFHEARGPEILRGNEDTDNAIEGRANITWEVQFTTQAKMVLFFTFDLDHLWSPNGWEGGNGQFIMNF